MDKDISGYHNLHRIIYISRATRKIYLDQSQCVKNILRVASQNNRRIDVTGALLACDDWFVQALEGRRVEVDILLDHIARDHNHYDICKISSKPIKSRAFAAWNMCASTLSPTDKAIVQVLKGTGKFDARQLNAETAIRLLLAVGRLQSADAAKVS